MNPSTNSKLKGQRGAALISAMLVVTLVATLASVALWQQWRHVEVESAERHRVQSSWLLNGALDWSRLILREDAIAGNSANSGSANGNADHLAEPWALPLKEITDAQSRINLTNWLEASDGKVSAKMNEPLQLALVRLFNVLDLPRAELDRLAPAWRAAAQSARLSNPAMGQASQGVANGVSLLPQQITQLQWLGLSPDTVQRLMPFVTILPETTPLNLNTASAEVIYATVPGLELTAAQQFVQQRTRAHFSNLSDASKALGGKPLEARWHAVGTRFFEVWGRLRMEDRTQEETALILRDSGNVTFVWRQKIAGILPPPNRESLLQSSQP